jgi:hypothetical protein
MSIMSINIYQQLLSVIIELWSCIIIIHDDNGSWVVLIVHHLSSFHLLSHWTDW